MTLFREIYFQSENEQQQTQTVQLIVKTIAQILLQQKANDSQTTHKMSEKYTECNIKNSENDLYELYNNYLHNIHNNGSICWLHIA